MVRVSLGFGLPVCSGLRLGSGLGLDLRSGLLTHSWRSDTINFLLAYCEITDLTLSLSLQLTISSSNRPRRRSLIYSIVQICTQSIEIRYHFVRERTILQNSSALMHMHRHYSGTESPAGVISAVSTAVTASKKTIQRSMSNIRFPHSLNKLSS